MPKILKSDRWFWCHSCKKEVLLEAHMWEDLCGECRIVLKPRIDQDFIEVTQEEYDRLRKESLERENIPDRE